MTSAIDSPGLPGPREVHLWRLSEKPDAVAALSAGGKELLSPEELERFNAMKRPGPAQRFLRGRVLMRSVLGMYLTENPSEVPLVISESGKPSVGENLSPELAISLSHADRETVFAVSGASSLGVDIEAMTRADAVTRISDEFFKPSEREYIELENEDQSKRALTIWCLKEAVVKAMGTTVWAGLADTTFGAVEGRLRALSLPGNSDWQFGLETGQMNGAYIAAIAMGGSNSQVFPAIRTFRMGSNWTETKEFVCDQPN